MGFLHTLEAGHTARAGLLALAALAAAPGARAQEGDAAAGRVRSAQTVTPGFPVAEHRVLDVDLDGRADLLVVGRRGEVRVWRSSAPGEGLAAEPVGALVLPHPERSLLAVADVLGDGGPPQLVVLSPDGVAVHRVADDGAYARGAVVVAPRAKLSLRVGWPRFAEICRDVNADGRADVVVPRGDACELWLNSPGSAAASDSAPPPPELLRAAVVRVEVRRDAELDAEALSDVLVNSFRIPDLAISDVNGDGRPDLLVEDGRRRSFHLQRADGTLPAAPDVSVDLSIFRDTTPEASVRLGRTLAGNDSQHYESRDLDGDGIPDHVIAHRRKVWVFHGTPQGPQFKEPTTVLKVADDVTALLLVRLDADPHPDLLLLRVQVPTVATLLRGLFSEWDVEIAALGYASLEGRSFAPEAAWKGEVSVRLPALLGVIRNPDALVRRFEEVAARFRESALGDFDGDGATDVALVSEDGRALDLWHGAPRQAADEDLEREVGRLFFGDGDPVWAVDRILAWIGTLAQRRASQLTGGRPAEAQFVLRDPDATRRSGLDAADLDGDGRAEIVLAYDTGGTREFDIVRWR